MFECSLILRIYDLYSKQDYAESKTDTCAKPLERILLFRWFFVCPAREVVSRTKLPKYLGPNNSKQRHSQQERENNIIQNHEFSIAISNLGYKKRAEVGSTAPVQSPKGHYIVAIDTYTSGSWRLGPSVELIHLVLNAKRRNSTSDLDFGVLSLLKASKAFLDVVVVVSQLLRFEGLVYLSAQKGIVGGVAVYVRMPHAKRDAFGRDQDLDILTETIQFGRGGAPNQTIVLAKLLTGFFELASGHNQRTNTMHNNGHDYSLGDRNWKEQNTFSTLSCTGEKSIMEAMYV